MHREYVTKFRALKASLAMLLITLLANSMLVPNKMQHVICTGNIGREQYEELCTLAPNVHVVEGDYDGVEDNDIPVTHHLQYQGQQSHQSLKFPEHQVVQVGQFRIGVIHGHQILPYKSQGAIARMRRKLNVDILISGHSHENQVVVHDGCYHINPVSQGKFVSTTTGESKFRTACLQ